jgi:hypothetical protein
MGELFHDQDNTDSGKHSLDDTGRNEVRHDPEADKTKNDLQYAGKYDGKEKYIEGPKGSDSARDNNGEACGRAAYRYM